MEESECRAVGNQIVEDVTEDKGPVSERGQEVASYDSQDEGQGTGRDSYGR